MTNENPPSFPRRRDWVVLAVGLLLVFGFCLGARGLNEPDEGRYANIARAMVDSGDWWEPRMSGFGHYDKPPLVYWVTALCLRFFGMNEWAVRLPSLLGASFSLFGLGWTAWRLRGPRIAWWSVLICGTSVQFFALGRILSPDMLLTGWCTLGVAAWAECKHRGGAWRWWLASLGFWTLAWWTKATPAFIPLAGLLVGVLATRDVLGWKVLRIWLLLPAILVLGAAWFLSMISLHPELRNFFFGRELAGRMTGHADGRRGSKIYYLAVSAVGWLPWWPLAAWSAWQQRTRLFSVARASTIKTWCIRLGIEGWMLVTGLIIFSLAASKLPTYTLTLAPWAALVMARLVVQLQEIRGNNTASFRPAAIAAGGFVLAAVAGTLVISYRETSLGVNSSLRSVCTFLRARGASRVDADQYWPGMEFYLGDNVIHYVVSHARQQERFTDPGLYPDRFIDPKRWPMLQTAVTQEDTTTTDLWLILFRKRQDSPFDKLLKGSDRHNLTKILGQFELVHARIAVDGKLTVVPLAP